MHKIVVLGIDGFNPETFRQCFTDLPQIKKMQQKGIWGSIESTVPPRAPQAWISSQCGQNPGTYGLWGYTYRDDFSYDESEMASSRVFDERVDYLYKILPKMGLRVALIHAPFTSPPPEVPGGYCISDFVPDSNEMGFTWPESLAQEVRALVGEYIFDPFDRSRDTEQTDKSKIAERICEMDEQRFKLIRHFMNKKNCDYIFGVMTGPKDIQRLFRSGAQPIHSDPYYEDVMLGYYKWIDTKIGEVHSNLDSNTGLMLYSPYNVQRSEGNLNLNEWFIHNGYMTLHEYPEKPTKFTNLNVDWANTQCWSIGNSGRIYINLKGREKKGVVPPDDYDELLKELRDKISEIQDEHGKAITIQVIEREEYHYGKYAEYGPDMFVYIQEPAWNTNDRVGHGLGQISTPDDQEDYDAGHNELYGYFSISGSDVPAKGKQKDISILSIAPTVMDVLKMEIPAQMEKPSILPMKEKIKKESPTSRKERVRSRREGLGY